MDAATRQETQEMKALRLRYEKEAAEMAARSQERLLKKQQDMIRKQEVENKLARLDRDREMLIQEQQQLQQSKQQKEQQQVQQQQQQQQRNASATRAERLAAVPADNRLAAFNRPMRASVAAAPVQNYAQPQPKVMKSQTTGRSSSMKAVERTEADQIAACDGCTL